MIQQQTIKAPKGHKPSKPDPNRTKLNLPKLIWGQHERTFTRINSSIVLISRNLTRKPTKAPHTTSANSCNAEPLYSDCMTEVFTLSARQSLASLQCKLISAACV
ncbi:hypothetical protein GOODEAATRI_025923 [Goodea atripinnis]|uniref:Uncharacterized protein n=1 Tax=Goodea atripinnis TaxID=208336 RepID=A0ABV0P7W1_9TELE